jgi:hypothetical protein
MSKDIGEGIFQVEVPDLEYLGLRAVVAIESRDRKLSEEVITLALGSAMYLQVRASKGCADSAEQVKARYELANEILSRTTAFRIDTSGQQG